MNRLRDLREDRDWTQKYVASLIGVAPNTMTNYENEKRQLTPELISKFCDIYDVTADYLLGRSSVPRSKWSKLDHDLVTAYRAAPLKIQKVVRDLLELDEEAEADEDAASVS